MKKDIVDQIKILKEVKPSSNWLKAQRSNLLLEISQSDKPSPAWKLSDFLLPRFSFSRAVVSFLFISLMFSGGFLAAGVAQESLAGDLLYPIKLAVEKIKIKVSNQDTKSKLRAEYMGVRVQELSDLIDSEQNLTEGRKKIVRTVDVLQAQVLNTRLNLDKIKDAQPEKAIKMTELITEQTLKSEKILIEVKEKFTQGEESKELLKALEALASETSTLAVEVEEMKAGIEVRMEVKETDLEVEDNVIVTSPVESLIKEASESFEKL